MTTEGGVSGLRGVLRASAAFVCLAPAVTLALTGGPSEPTVSGKAAVSADGLVDPFTGDFEYVIPLFDLPGPGGSYPFAVAYRSGIQTEQEASWIGLGWTLEPGRISRSIRGVPDDVAGDDVHQLFSQREAKRFGATGTAGIEFLGLDSRLVKIGGDIGLTVFFDTYSGYGLGLVISQSARVSIDDDLDANLGISADLNTQNGMTVAPTLGLNVGMGHLNPSFGASYNSTTGLESAYWGYASIPLFPPSYVAATQRAQYGESAEFSFKVGVELWGYYPEGKLVGYSSTTMFGLPPTVKAYGYLHLHEASNPSAAQLDFVREKDSPLKPNTPYLPFSAIAADAFEIATSGGLSGGFRAYRTDLPVLTDPTVESFNISEIGSGEVGVGSLVHLGASEQVATAQSESSSWLSKNYFAAAAGSAAVPPERAYFALISEPSVDDGVAHADEPRFVRLPDTGTASDTLVGLDGQSAAIPPPTAAYARATRIRAVTEMEFALGTEDWVGQFTHVTRPGDVAPERIAGFEVTLPDGTRYVFAQPAYVEKEINCSFSVDPAPVDFLPGETAVKIPAALGDAIASWWSDPTSAPALSLPDTTDQFLSCTMTPAYAHSYHLTSVLGADYVDIGFDGPTDDDLGHWVRFDYVEVPNYAYRSPYNGAHYARGFEDSYLTDDRGSLTYGVKQLFFLVRAVTASHQALFALSDDALALAKQCAGDDAFLELAPEGRSDARGASSVAKNEGAPSSDAGSQPRLLGAVLCRRGDDVPIKSVYLEHDYHLATGVPNGELDQGKLTLTKLWFEDGQDESGKRSPYEFVYDLSPTDNPRYQDPLHLGDRNSDRWGYYQECQGRPSYLDPSEKDRCSNGEEPYTRQVEENSSAAAWSLRAIATPSRARVEIDYEPDDYAFVQDERAAVFVSACNKRQTIPAKTSTPIICVDLAKLGFVRAPEKPDEANTLADSLFDGVSDLAFSADIKLRDDLLDHKELWSRVRGYVEPATWVVENCSPAECKVQVTLRPSTVGGTDYHPLAFAGWQHLKLNQPQYAVPGVSPPGVGDSPDEQLVDQARGLVQMIVRIKDVFDNFAERASSEGWASEADNLKLRVFMPTRKKRGGGARVTRLRLCDARSLSSGEQCDASDPAVTIGKAYRYEMEDERSYAGQPISSGVAAYEPSIGGDEISLRRPHPFKDRNAIWAPSDPTYFELPIAESLFPAPIVGYRRVVEQTFAGALAGAWSHEHPDLPPLSLAGVRVHEFYTAKEFPVRAEATAVHKPAPKREMLMIPGIGTLLHEAFAASQGYRIELNDMHGKPRRITECAVGLDGHPIDGSDRQTTYIYNTTARRIDPAIPAVHLRDAKRRESTALGERVEYYADMRQSISETNSMGLSINTDVMQIGPWPIPLGADRPKSRCDSKVGQGRAFVHL